MKNRMSFFAKSFLCSFIILSSCVSSVKDAPVALRQPQAEEWAATLTENPIPVAVFFGDNISATVKGRVTELLTKSLKNMRFNQACAPEEKCLELHFGLTETSSGLISQAEKNQLSSEGFIIRTQLAGLNLKITVDAKNSDANASEQAKRGLSYGAYAVLQDIGFRFLHPLKPTHDSFDLNFDTLVKTSRTENPRWPVRSIHLHTMHPLELTNVLNGWGISGPQDEAGWRSMMPYWSLYLEWLIAHKQNEVEWPILWDTDTESYNQSATRQNRLKEINRVAHSWGIESGVVAPIRFVQQNGWTLLRNHKARIGQPNEKQDNLNEIKSNLNWLLDAGFSAVGGELGEGEFSSAPAQDTVAELNSIADYLKTKDIPYRVKVHVSTKQFAQGFPDPQTKKDINFNYLPLYASPNVGVLPHTIQIYSLDDPAPTYGNQNFLDMFRFTKMAASGSVRNQKREVLFYPETAYWVSYDIDVPLFLPVYAYRRVHDLRLIAIDETRGDMKKTNSRINGQVIFSSGWEWGYWFNDMIAAEASWDPKVGAANSLQAFNQITAQTLRLPAQNEFVNAISTTAVDQHRLLVNGQTKAGKPSIVEKRTGIAYLAGTDVWDDLGILARQPILSQVPGIDKIPLTQPNKFRDDWAFSYIDLTYLNEIKYNSELKPLLTEMSQTFQSNFRNFSNVRQLSLPAGLHFYAQEFSDGARINSLRADFVLKLYSERLAKSKFRTPDILGLQQLINRATLVTRSRLEQVPMRAEHKPLISVWENARFNNPTDYHFGYLWSSYNLFYWQRELNKLANANASSQACYMNITKVSELESKKGSYVPFFEYVAQHIGPISGCGQIPSSEPDLKAGW